jgi:hypothetical protein
MVKTRSLVVAATLTAAALVLGTGASLAHAARCTGTPPEYNPGDLLQKQAGVSASARLALAIRYREYLASCHEAPAHRYQRG